MDLEGNNITVVCICGKFLQKQYIGIRNVSFKVWHCCLLLSSLGLFSFYYCYCWYMIVVRRPLLPFPSCSSSSWPFPPLYSECWTNNGFLPWPCCGGVCSCSRCAVHAGLFPLWPWALHVHYMLWWKAIMLAGLWVNSSSWPLDAFVICSVRLFEAEMELKMWLIESPNICLVSLVLEDPWWPVSWEKDDL